MTINLKVFVTKKNRSMTKKTIVGELILGL